MKSGSLVALPRNWVSLWITDSLRKYFVIKNSTNLRVSESFDVFAIISDWGVVFTKENIRKLAGLKIWGSGSPAIRVLGCPVWFPWFPWSCGVLGWTFPAGLIDVCLLVDAFHIGKHNVMTSADLRRRLPKNCIIGVG